MPKRLSDLNDPDLDDDDSMQVEPVIRTDLQTVAAPQSTFAVQKKFKDNSQQARTTAFVQAKVDTKTSADEDGKKYAKNLFKSRKEFYPKLRELAAAARDGKQEAIALITKIDDLFQQNHGFKEKVAGWVRVKATKGKGMERGAGLDEIFKTSETMYFLKWAAGMLPGKEAESVIEGPDGSTLRFTVLDLQQLIRMPTSVVLTKEGEGHVGALIDQFSKAPLTKGQPGLHAFRQDFIEAAPTPLEALFAALYGHLEITPNVDTVKEMHNKGVDVYGRNFANPADKEKMVEEAGRVRDILKAILTELRRAMPTYTLYRQLSDYFGTPPKFPFDYKAVPPLAKMI